MSINLVLSFDVEVAEGKPSRSQIERAVRTAVQNAILFSEENGHDYGDELSADEDISLMLTEVL